MSYCGVLGSTERIIMGKRFFNELMRAYVYPDRVIMAVMALIVLWKSTSLGIACLALIGLSIIYHTWLSGSYVSERLSEFEQSFIREKDAIVESYANNTPLVLCVVDAEATVHWANKTYSQLFATEEASREVITKAFIKPFLDAPGHTEELALGDRYYKISSSVLEGAEDKVMLFWENISARTLIKKLYEESRPCIGFIKIDNFDELLASSPAEEQSGITAEIDRLLQQWATGLDASLVKIRNSRYLFVIEEKQLELLVGDSFSILDKIHGVETQSDFPASISIGLGVGSPTMAELHKDAAEALELALGRGGDQAVLQRRGESPEFYGGALTTVEKRNKGKSRVVAHALTQLMMGADQVMIMGHSKPDLDAYGSAIGIYALARKVGTKADIVLEDPGEAVEIIHEAAKQTGLFSFLSRTQALERLTPQTLLVVVDAHRAVITECPQLVEAAEKIVVIDHHRRSPDAIERPTLTHMETYASSASELVTEILQYSGEKGSYDKFEMEALLAGIMVDTKNFAINTGVRTFDAASWLRRGGADSSEVRGFFKMSLDFYRKKANIISNAEIIDGSIAVAYTKESDPSMQVLVAQAADDLLGMKGVEAAFTAGYGPSRTVVSARSLGKVNVQTIMEAMGGGGHVNVAAAQVEISPEEALQQIIQTIRKNNDA